MTSALWPVSRIDEYTAQVNRALDRFYATEYPAIQLEAMRRPGPGTCEMSYASVWPGIADDCYRNAFVTDLNSGMSMCRKCARENCPEILGEA